MEGPADICPSAARIAQRLGNRLLMARLRRGLSQTHLAEMVGIGSGSTIAKFEAGKRPPSLPTLIKLAAALEIETHALLDGLDDRQLPPEDPSPLDGAIVLELIRRRAVTLESPHIRKVVYSNLDKLDDRTLRRLLEDLAGGGPGSNDGSHAA